MDVDLTLRTGFAEHAILVSTSIAHVEPRIAAEGAREVLRVVKGNDRARRL